MSDVDNRDFRAKTAKQLRLSKSRAGCAACDKSDFPGKFFHAYHSFNWFIFHYFYFT